jgi:hypothetical protein
VTKDPFGLPPGLAAEHLAAIQRVGPRPEEMEALRREQRPVQEQLRRVKQESERLAQDDKLRGRVLARRSELRTRIANAQRQIEAWQEEKKEAETELAALSPAVGTASPAPADPPPRETPANAAPASTVSATPDPSPVPQSQPAVEHSPRALVRRFLDENPMPGVSAARIRKAMGGRDDDPRPVPGSWVANEATRLRLTLNVPSKSTIERELEERQASVSRAST